MNYRKLKYIALALALATSSAFAEESAGIFVEPGITYEWGKAHINYPAPLNNLDGSLNGVGVMGRAGFHVNEIFFIAADGRFSKPEFKSDNGSYQSKSTAYNWGITGGAQMPVAGARAWISRVIGGMVDSDPSNGLDVKYATARGWRLGVGLKVFSVSVNFEYQDLSYSDLEVQQVGPFSNNTVFAGTKLKNKSILMSLTFPFTL